MSILILYNTKSGFTKEHAESICEQVPNSVVSNLKELNYDLNDFKTIVVGAPIYSGELDDAAKQFFKTNKKILLQKRLGLFCAGMNTEEFNDAVQNSLPADIFYHAYIVHSGGRIKYKSLSLKNKLTIRRRLGIKGDVLIENEQKMNEFLRWMKQE